MRKLFIAILCISIQTRAHAEPDVGKIILNTGDAKTVELRDAVRVHVSRKGIIHLVHDHDDYWSVTALRTGVVAIETKLKSSGIRTSYADVRQRQEKSANPRAGRQDLASPNDKDCEPGHVQFETHTTVELVDNYNLEATGVDSEAIFRWRNGAFETGIGAGVDPRQSQYDRHIVGDPVITSRPCEDLIIRAGGEDEFQSKTDSGHVISTWKSHGLDIKLKLIPLEDHLLKIPFSVSLRTPSRGKGSYGLSDITAAINIFPGQKKLAAIINLSSSSASSAEQPWLASVPIIGPLFQNSEDSRSSSKLLLWLQIFQISPETPNP